MVYSLIDSFKFVMQNLNIDSSHKDVESAVSQLFREQAQYQTDKMNNGSWAAICEHIADTLQAEAKRNEKVGRKKNDEKFTQRYNDYCDLINKGLAPKEVMEKMNISESTYFRYKKLKKQDGR